MNSFVYIFFDLRCLILKSIIESTEINFYFFASRSKSYHRLISAISSARAVIVCLKINAIRNACSSLSFNHVLYSSDISIAELIIPEQMVIRISNLPNGYICCITEQVVAKPLLFVRFFWRIDFFNLCSNLAGPVIRISIVNI